MSPRCGEAQGGRQPALRAALLAAELAACEAGHLPSRYARNGRLTSPAQQAMLLRARVLLVGLGGLGGHVLDGLCRMGVGQIMGVDGDSFEQSNLNRQLLCTSETLGQSKVQAAQGYARRVNTAVEFVPVAEYVRGAALQALVWGGFVRPDDSTAQALPFDVVVDALGGLDDRPALHAAARQAGIPVVAAGIAGLTGWVQVVQASQAGVMEYFSQVEPPSFSTIPKAATNALQNSEKNAAHVCVPSAEELLGNLSPTVLVAAGVQCAQVYSLLTGGKPKAHMLIFDLQDASFHTIDLQNGPK